MAERHVRDLLGEALRRGGWVRSMRRADAVLRWPEVVGRDVARFARAVALQSGTLVVEVADAETAMHLGLQRQRILDAYRTRFGDADVRDLRFRVGGGPGTTDPDVRPAAAVAPDPDEVADLTAGLGALPEGLVAPADAAGRALATGRARRRAAGWRPCPICGALADPEVRSDAPPPFAALVPAAGRHLCAACARHATAPKVVDAATRLLVAPGAATPALTDDERAVARALATGREVLASQREPHADDVRSRTVVAVPVEVDGTVLGVFEVVGPEPRAFLGETTMALRMAASLLGLLWHNHDLWTREERGRAVLAASEARLAHRLEQLSALHRIDRAITSGQALAATLDLSVRQVVQRLGVDAACVLVRDDDARVLRPAASAGFRAAPSAAAVVPLGVGVAGSMVDGEGHVSIDGRERLRAGFTRAALIEDEGVEAYDAVPLRAHGEFHGVLEVFHRAPSPRGAEWTADLEAFGDQIAIAIDQASTASALRETNRQLVEAYDTTIEGWAAALDLRDEETQGHSRRVTDLAVRLAERLGVPRADLEHIRRGALLHDIGKMGVPDAILSKPGPLDEAEWAVMKQHPALAHQLLSGTPFLRDALDIPYGHHERWDGRGYPRGLAGEAIPLAARIFAVVDVYDALSSDRPYRSAWPRDRVLSHLREESGRHFDPTVVGAFLELIEA